MTCLHRKGLRVLIILAPTVDNIRYIRIRIDRWKIRWMDGSGMDLGWMNMNLFK